MNNEDNIAQKGLKKLFEEFFNLIDTTNKYTIAKSIFELMEYIVTFDEDFSPGSILYENKFVIGFEEIEIPIDDINYEKLEIYEEIIKEKYKDKTKHKDNIPRMEQYIIPLKEMLNDIDILNMLEETGIIDDMLNVYNQLKDYYRKIIV